MWLYGKALCNIAKIYFDDKNYTSALDVLGRVPQLSETIIKALELKYELYKAQKQNELEVKFYKWLFIAMNNKYNSDNYGYDGSYGDITEQDELEFWDSINKESSKHAYAVLRKAFVYKKMNAHDKAKELLDSISQEKRDEIAQKYKVNFEEIEKNEN